jgi:hypothetical protein
MAMTDLDQLRKQASDAYDQGKPLLVEDPRVILHLLDTITTLMDGDSLLAQGQRIANDAINKMVEARRERDEALAKLEALEKKP